MLMLYRLGAAYVLSERLASQHLFATKFVMMSRNWQALFDFLPVTTTDGKQATGDEMVLLP